MGLLAVLLGSQTAVGLHGTPILVEANLAQNYHQRGADILTDDSAGNAYLIYNSAPFGPAVVLARITPTGTVTKVQLAGPSSTSPLLATVRNAGAAVARVHDDAIYVFMIVTLLDDSRQYLAAKCTDLANIGSASCWTKFDGSAGVDLLPWEGDFDFGMDIDSSGQVYISGTQGNNRRVRVRNFTPGVGWSAWQLVGIASTGVVRFTDIEVDDDTGIVHVVAGNNVGFIVTTIHARGASPGAIPSGLVTVTKPPNPDFFVGQGGLATFPNNQVLVLGSTGPWTSWNFFDGTAWVFGTSPPSSTAGTFPPFGFTGDTDNLLVGAVSKAPDGKARAFTMKREDGVNKYQLRSFDPATQSWSAPTLIHTTPPPVHFSIRSVLATRLDPNPNSCNQWYAWFDPHQGKLFADFEGPGKCKIVVAMDIKPQSCPNPLNCKRKGVLPVAILGTEDFDVTQIDTELVQLELVGVHPLRVAFEDVATPFEPFTGKQDCLECTTEGPDGFLDLTLKFDTQAVLDAIGPAEDEACLVLELTGKLKDEFDGTPIVGEDVVRFLCKGGKP
jgi:hypothetical protein